MSASALAVKVEACWLRLRFVKIAKAMTMEDQKLSDLPDKKCEACRVGAPLATPDAISRFMQELPKWDIVQVEGIHRLTRTFS